MSSKTSAGKVGFVNSTNDFRKVFNALKVVWPVLVVFFFALKISIFLYDFIMGSQDRSNIQLTKKEVDDKLHQYMLINKQISKTLTVQRIEIAKLKKKLNDSTLNSMNLQIENNHWKMQFRALSQMYVEHNNSVYGAVSANINKFHIKFGEDIVGNGSSSAGRSVAEPEPTTLSRSADYSRRVSKSFESIKNRSVKQYSESKSKRKFSSKRKNEKILLQS